MLLEKAVKIGGRYVCGKKIPLTVALLTGILTHMFAFTNKLVNHDEASQLFRKGGTATSGRWGLDVTSCIFPDFSMPWIYGLLSIVFIALSVCLIIDLFQLKSKTVQAVLAALILSFPSLIGTISYTFTAAPYAFSFFCCTLAVKWMCDKRWWPKPLAVLLMSLSLGIYQSYIALAAVLCLVYIFRRFMSEEGSTKSILLQGVLLVVLLGASLALYYGITYATLWVMGETLNEYAGGALGADSGIISRLVVAYDEFFSFFDGEYGLMPSRSAQWIHKIWCAVVACNLLLIWMKKKIGSKVFMALLVGVLPLAVNCVFLVTASEAVHTLVLYGFVGIYVFGAVVLEYAYTEKMWSGTVEKARCYSCEAAAVLMCLLAIINVYLGNQAYLRLHMQYENAYSFYTTVMTQVRMTPGFDKNTKVALVGKTYFANQYPEFREAKQIMGTNSDMINVHAYRSFVRYYIGDDEVIFASNEQIAAIRETEEFQKMPVYPYYGSVQEVDGVIVVKLSE